MSDNRTDRAVAFLFGGDRSALHCYVHKTYDTNELGRVATCARNAQVASDGQRREMDLPRVEDALIRAGLNQSGLTARLKVSRKAVSNWMRGASFPQPDKLIRIGRLEGTEVRRSG